MQIHQFISQSQPLLAIHSRRFSLSFSVSLSSQWLSSSCAIEKNCHNLCLNSRCLKGLYSSRIQHWLKLKMEDSSAWNGRRWELTGQWLIHTCLYCCVWLGNDRSHFRTFYVIGKCSAWSCLSISTNLYSRNRSIVQARRASEGDCGRWDGEAACDRTRHQ